MKNSNKNKDHSKFHRWLNWPNKSNRKCIICGCIQHKTYNNSTGKTVITYERNGVINNVFIDCTKPDYN